METLRNMSHKDGVTHPLSHSDSSARNAAELPFGLHRAAVFALRLRGTTENLALSHIVLRTFCDSNGGVCDSDKGADVTQKRQTLVEAARKTRRIFNAKVPGVHHAFLIGGVQFYAGGPVTPPVISTFRQYTNAIGLKTRVLDLYPAGGEHLMLTPGPDIRRAELPKGVWDMMALRLLLDASPVDVVKGDQPLA